VPVCLRSVIAAGAKGLFSARYPAFALDRMEPMRPVVDRAILDRVKTATFSACDFSIQLDGVCRLNPELARRVAQTPCITRVRQLTLT